MFWLTKDISLDTQSPPVATPYVSCCVVMSTNDSYQSIDSVSLSVIVRTNNGNKLFTLSLTTPLPLLYNPTFTIRTITRGGRWLKFKFFFFFLIRHYFIRYSRTVSHGSGFDLKYLPKIITTHTTTWRCQVQGNDAPPHCCCTCRRPTYL